MPIYEFACKKCENNFDVLMSASSKSKPKCPECGSRTVSRKFSTFGMGGGGGGADPFKIVGAGSGHSHGGGGGCGSCGGGSCSTCH